jgi:hypothetical protein
MIELGMDVHTCIEKIVFSLPDIKTCHLKVYTPSRGFEERIASQSKNKELHTIVEEARRIRDLVSGSMPYWESLVRSAWRSPVLHLVASEALRHDDAHDAIRVYDVAADECSARNLKERIRSISSDDLLAFSSLMHGANNDEWHLPMLDLRVVPSPQNLDSLLIFLETMALKGAVLESGRSYHYYGYVPLSAHEWHRFVGLAMLAYPITDGRYIGHRLLGGSFDLRISTSPMKPILPHVVALL